MKKTYLVAGFRKGEKESSIYTLNSHNYDEKTLRSTFAWIDGPDNNNFRKGSTPITLAELISDLQEKGAIWCENDDFCYVFKVG